MEMELKMVDQRSKSAVAADADRGYRQSMKQQITDAESTLHPRRHTQNPTPRKHDDPRLGSALKLFKAWVKLRKANVKGTNLDYHKLHP